jgi:protocatechuate 3,4-dioxygenase, beta subunit
MGNKMKNIFSAFKINSGLLFSILFIAAFISCQKAESNNISGDKWKAVFASENEPGQKLIVSGIVYDSDGETPLEGITVYAYHTNAEGYYGKGDDLLDGTMITNGDGQFEFSTIKPGSYPGRNNPAHIHFKITGKGISEQWFDLHFEGDPLIPESLVAKEKSKGKFSGIVKPSPDQKGILICTIDIKINR